MSEAFSSAWVWPSAPLISLIATGVGIASALPALSRRLGSAQTAHLVPFSGGLLVGIAVFGVLPELAGLRGLVWGLDLLAAGVGLLWLVNRYVFPVCPSCSHTHEHATCEVTLHGFALPMVVAVSLHALLDGVGIAAAYLESAQGLGTPVIVAVLIHKVPEGIALGVMLRAALQSRLAALAWCVAAEGATFVGGLLYVLAGPPVGKGWASYALAAAGGSFLYLGFHAAHGAWKRMGLSALWLAVAGGAVAAALKQGMHLVAP